MMAISDIPFIVKVCGVTSLNDAQAAIDAGANALGFNFYSKSPRYLSFDEASGMISDLKGEFLRVGVFVNPSIQELTLASPFLDVLQIHGEPPVARAVLPVWQAADPTAFEAASCWPDSTGETAYPAKAARTSGDFQSQRNLPASAGSRSAKTVATKNGPVQAWLLDTATPAFGGSGKTFDWTLAAQFPYRIIVAGGLGANNVAEAIRTAKPWGVDSCSRLESAPGRKDHARVAAFVSQAREAFHALQAVSI